MKKVLSIIAIVIVSFTLNVKAQNAPGLPTRVQSPFGPVTTSTIAVTGATTVPVINNVMYVDASTAPLTGNITINLTLNLTSKVGSKIFMKITTTGVQTVNFGTGFICPTLTGVVNKTFACVFYFDGFNYIPTGQPYQIN